MPEALNPFFQTLYGALVPVITAFEIELVSFCVVGVTLGQSPLLLTAQAQAQLRRDLSGNLGLHIKNIRRASVVLLTPNLRPVRHVNQLGLNIQSVAAI